MSARIFSLHVPRWVAKGQYDPLRTVTVVLPTMDKIEAELTEVLDNASQAPRETRTRINAPLTTPTLRQQAEEAAL